MASNSKKHSWQEGLRLMSQCPVCHHDLKKEAAQLVEEKSEANLVHLTCVNCRNSLLVLIAVGPLGMSAVGMLTDLSLNDAKRILAKAQISEDELLSFYTFLKNQQFNFKY